MVYIIPDKTTRMNQLRHNDALTTGPQVCCYCDDDDSYFDHYYALKCHVLKVHPNEYKTFLRIKIGKLGVDKDSIAITSKRFISFAEERKKLYSRKRKKLARGNREIKTYPPQRLSVRTRTKTVREPVIPEPIGTLILCNFCGDEFYDLRYLCWHLKIRHEVQRYGEPVLMQSGMPKKSNINEASSCSSNKSLDGFHGMPSFPNACVDAKEGVRTPSLREKKMAQLVCKRCSQVFLDSLSLKRHLSSHVKYKTFKCTTCHTNYLNRKRFQEHVARCHQKTSSDQGEATIICTTNSKDDFLSPQKVIKTALNCFLCKKTFSEGRGFTQHVKYVHSNLQTFRCEYCKEQVSVAELGKHVTEHERPYQCKICKKKFRDEKEKCIHERKHLSFGVKTHECHKCGKTYFYESSLHRHLATFHQRQRHRVSV